MLLYSHNRAGHLKLKLRHRDNTYETGDMSQCTNMGSVPSRYDFFAKKEVKYWLTFTRKQPLSQVLFNS